MSGTVAKIGTARFGNRRPVPKEKGKKAGGGNEAPEGKIMRRFVVAAGKGCLLDCGGRKGMPIGLVCVSDGGVRGRNALVLDTPKKEIAGNGK